MKIFRLKSYFLVFKRYVRGYLEKKIQRRLVLNFVGLGVLPIIIVSLVLMRLAETTVQTHVFERNYEIAKEASKEISLFLKEPVTILKTSSQSRDIREMERFTQSRLINSLKEESSNIFTKIYILDQSGKAVVTTSFGEELKDFSRDPVYYVTITNKEYFSGVYFLPSPSRLPAMSIALPIRRYNTVEGVLAGEIDLKSIWALVDSIKVGQTGFAFLISADGSVIAHPDKQKVLSQQHSYQDYFFYEELAKGNEGIDFFIENDISYIAAYIPVTEFGWGVVVQQTEEEAFGLLRQMRIQVGIFLLITTVLALFLAFGTIRRIIRPIENLVQGVRAYASGDLHHRIKIKRQDEIVSLADEFNKMAESLEKNQRQLRRMERLAATSRFASLVSHEIRNPLNAMNINMQILRRLISQADSPPEKKYKYLNIITSEINRMNSLVTNFLTITRPPELNLIRSDIHQILEEVLLLLEAQARNLAITISRKYTTKNLYGMLDYNQLKQVFQNILLNAFEAMPDGGKIRIKTGICPPADKDSSENRKVIITISDTGPGIPRQKIHEIFEFYYTTKKTGTGLGLAIAKQIIEGHKGEIRVESEEGKGTAVSILLPLEG